MRERTDEVNLSGSFTDRLNPKFETSNRPGIGDLGASRLPTPMVRNTEARAVPEQDARRHARIGLPGHFKR
jgi:hypothetical protein